MGRAIALREDFDGPGLRHLATRSKDGPQSRRLLALAEIYDGGRRMDAARIGGVGLQVIRDWVLRFNAEGPDGLIDRKAPGPQPKLNDEQRQALARMIEDGPVPAVHGVVRWRRKDLALWTGASAPVSCCHAATPRPCNGTSTRFHRRWRQTPMPC